MESKEGNPGLGLAAPAPAAAAGEMACAPVPQKVLEEAAGFALPVNFHGNLVTATTDEQLTEILSNAKACKRPAVVNYGASCPRTRIASASGATRVNKCFPLSAT